MQRQIQRSLLISMAFLFLSRSEAYAAAGASIEAGLENQQFYEAYGYCQNPSFGTMPNGVNGVALDFVIANPSGAQTLMGWTAGNYSGLQTYSGAFVENYYIDSSNVGHLAFFPLGPYGGTLFKFSSTPGSAYHNVYIAGKLAAGNLYGGQSIETAVAVGVFDNSVVSYGIDKNPTAFPTFTNEDPCNSLYIQLAGNPSPWAGNQSFYVYDRPPSLQPDSHVFFNTATDGVDMFR